MLGVRSNHPRCYIEAKFGMFGGVPDIVLAFSFQQNRLRGFGLLMAENWLSIFNASGLYDSSLLLHEPDTYKIYNQLHMKMTSLTQMVSLYATITTI